MIPQLLRQWIVMQNNRHCSMSEMMDWVPVETDGIRSGFSNVQLVHLKRQILHDRKKARECCVSLIDQICDKKFKFLYEPPRKKGVDITATWEEDLANTRINWLEIVAALRDLMGWIEKQKEYKYPAERYYENDCRPSNE